WAWRCRTRRTRCAAPPIGWRRPRPTGGCFACSPSCSPVTSPSAMAVHPDPWRAVDRQPDPGGFARMMESRGRTPTQVRVRRRFLRFCRIEPGWRVLEVGSGSGVVARDLAALVGPRGHVTGVDKSRVLTAAARRAAREAGLARRVDFRLADA